MAKQADTPNHNLIRSRYRILRSMWGSDAEALTGTAKAFRGAGVTQEQVRAICEGGEA